MISCLKKLRVNHPSNGSYIRTEGSQQKGMCVSSSERVKSGKLMMNKTKQEVIVGIIPVELLWIRSLQLSMETTETESGVNI